MIFLIALLILGVILAQRRASKRVERAIKRATADLLRNR